ncbi:cob(I)yrinic acid a,c-diamide adenosyltransferase [Candidatus Nomurabacteria bacterium]|nr:cob(I)yrinic acid a,c-diamide adenosyltransferase [Candidatus Nomurabacteria bacterium]
MLYTRKGDSGTTKLFNCAVGVRVAKSNFIFEALGALDELNSVLGYAKALCKKAGIVVFTGERRIHYDEILHIFQEGLFLAQAELGGSPVRIKKTDVLFLEKIIFEIETMLPPIKSFIVPGGGEAGSYLDIARTIARRAERQIVSLGSGKENCVEDCTLQFLNRLSSALYALARFANYQEGYLERKPEYKC